MLNNGAGAQYPGGPGQPNAGAYIGLANNAQNIQSLQAGGYGMQGQMTANRHGVPSQNTAMNGALGNVTSNLQQLGLGQAPRVGLQHQQPYAGISNGAVNGRGVGNPPNGPQGVQHGRMPGYPGLEGNAVVTGYGANLAALQRQHGGVPGSGGISQGGRPGPPGYSAPSGDLLNLLNKAVGGSRGDDVPAFDTGDFPSLAPSSAPRPPSNPGVIPGDGALTDGSFAALLGKSAPPTAPPAFQDDDFPALPGAASTTPEATHGVQATSDPVPTAAAQPARPDGGDHPAAERYGLLGLLSVIRMTDPDLTTLALGTDLTTLGLNLSSSEPLWWTFGSPWSDGPARERDPDCRPPDSFLVPPPRLSASHFSAMQPDGLFFAFYAMPGDEAQFLAASELSSRGWSFSRDLEAWITPASAQDPPVSNEHGERGSFFLFDPNAWEVVRKDDLVIPFSSLEGVPLLPPPSEGLATASTYRSQLR